MTVFKTFWKVVKRYKGTIIGFTLMLVIFGSINMSSNDVTSSFKETKPDIIIVNNDNTIVADGLVSYFKENANIIDVKNTERAIDDAIFYRDASYVIYIPDGYEDNILNGGNGNIEIKSSGDYTSNLAEMLLTRYIKAIKVLSKEYSDKTTLLSKVNNALDENSKYMVICSDGVWEFSNNEDIMSIGIEYYLKDNIGEFIEKIIKVSEFWWEKEDIIRDDITAVVVYF